jgi:hypothetical protein
VGFHGSNRPDEAIDDNIVSLLDGLPAKQLGDGAVCLLRDMSVEAGDATWTEDARDTGRSKHMSGPHGSQVTWDLFLVE